MKEPLEFHAHTGQVLDLAFTPRGGDLLSGGSDNLIQRWSTLSWEKIQTIHAHEQSVNAIALSPDGKKLVSGSSDHTTKIWALPSGELLHTLEGDQKPVTAVRVSPRGGQFATASTSGVVRFWSLDKGNEQKTLKDQTMKSIACLAFSQNAEVLACGGESEEVLVWKMPGGSLESRLPGHKPPVTSLAFSTDDLFLLTADADGVLRLWDAKTWQPVWNLPLEAKGIYPLAFDPIQKRFAVGMAYKALLVTTQEGLVTQELAVEPQGVTSLAFSPDGAWLAMGAADQKIRVWKMEKT